MGCEADFLFPVGDAFLAEGNRDQGSIDADEVDSVTPGKQKPAAKSLACTLVVDVGTDALEESDSEVADMQF